MNYLFIYSPSIFLIIGNIDKVEFRKIFFFEMSESGIKMPFKIISKQRAICKIQFISLKVADTFSDIGGARLLFQLNSTVYFYCL